MRRNVCKLFLLMVLSFFVVLEFSSCNLEPEIYNISYNLNGGTNDGSNPVTYNIDTPTITLASPTKSGYTFVGWYDNSGFSGSPITEITKGSTGDKTFFAKWTANEHTLSFSANGGNGTMDTLKAVTDEEITLPLNTFTRDGYTFTGWATSSDGSKIDSYTMGISDTTLYAKWTANEHTLSFSANGGNGTMDTLKAVTDEEITLPSNPFTRDGYTFTGWATSSDGSKIYDDEDNYTMGISDTTLYAIWTANTYTISFNSQDGNGGPTSVTATYDQTMPDANAPTKTGYTFGGYYEEINGGGTKYYNESMESIIVWNIAKDTTLYANWNIINYYINYNLSEETNNGANPVTFTIETTPITLASPTRDGYTFVNWYDNSGFSGSSITEITKGSTGNKTLYAKWTANTYTITFNSQGGTEGSTSVTATYDQAMPDANAPTKTGYTFGGYYDEINGSGTKYYNESMESIIVWNIAGNTTLYAKWNIINYDINYNLNEETNNGANPVTFTIETTPITLASPTRDGYTFFGWYDNSEFSGSSITEITEGSTGNKTLYAKWSADNLSNAICGSYNYSVTNRKATITDYYGSETEIMIPTTLDGYTVTSIGESAFKSCKELISVEIPNSVTSIGEEAFFYCSGLTSVTIGNSVISIGNNAFKSCTELISVEIPDSVTSIGDAAFDSCEELFSVSIGNSVTSIGVTAFSNCEKLSSVTIGNSVSSIGSYAFYYCWYLTNIKIEAINPPVLGKKAFDYNNVSRKIYVPSAGVASYKAALDWSDYSEYIYSLEE